MKPVGLFLLVCLAVAACNKNTENKSKLEGKWTLTAMFLQTSGPGSWHVEDSIPPNYIQFNRDGSLTMSSYVSFLYNGPVGYTVVNDTTMVFNYPNGNDLNGENVMHYKLSDTTLMITPPAFELVIEKYSRLQ
jgi:hypothetical protein